MRITVHAKTRARTEVVEQLSPGNFKIAVKQPPIDGKANDAIIQLLSEYFDVPKSAIVLKSGHTAKIKIFDIEDHRS